VLEASVVGFSDASEIPDYQEEIDKSDKWILIKFLMQKDEKPEDLLRFTKFLMKIYRILKESLTLSRKNP
jgi:hypothetical protein